ncbi:MAG TPA: TonB-dependent receptor [Saprospiraceae bacterium]|nr:TonB-dependent receptor [Saprospiraceae bacterium]HMP23247.1 TonB-dependent receptor [Saprospiraceae bacterium]
MKSFVTILSITSLALLCRTTSQAQENNLSASTDNSTALKNSLSANASNDTLLFYEMPAVRILGEKPRLMSDVPGSATFLSKKTLQSLQPINGNEVLRTVPGLHIVEEEGIGMRINIGIRGLDPDRSSRVLVLEDGIPVALNPFGEPQMYYTPAIDRMESIEVLKGSGQILFGPQTIGGVVNYITADPPASSAGRVKITGGDGGFLSTLLGYGNTVGNVGFQVNYLRKQADNVGPTSFRINDLTTKLKFQLGNKSTVGVKLGYYDENSNSTYIGLTQTMYDQGGQDFVRMAPDDRLAVQRISGSLSHEYRFNLNVKLATTAFAYSTVRNWQRQDFSENPTVSNQTGVVWGNPEVPGGAIYMRNQNGHRNRQFEVAGIESRLTARHRTLGIGGKLEGGLRYMTEKAFEQRVNGTKADAQSGALVNDEIRSGQALSAFLQNKFYLSDRLTLTAGLRSEVYFYERNVLRSSQRDTSIIANTDITQLLPGAGLNYNFNDNWTVFGGVHRGFAPPRVANAITTEGVVYNLDPELSWNYELGLRGQIGEAIALEMTGFYMDFSNQVIPISESAGGAGSGLINGGSTLHRGIEAAVNVNVGQWLLPTQHTLELIGQVTYVNAFYNKDRFRGSGDNRVNIRDNRTPYAPEWLVSSSIRYEAPFGLQMRLTGNYISEQFTDELNTTTPAPNGRVGLMPSYFTVDAAAGYEITKLNLTFNLAVKNLTDERYIVSRRPQGIRVGLPRFVTAGVDFRF